MTGLELLEKFPKAADVIKEFYNNKMINSLEEDGNIPQDFKEMVRAQSFDSEYVAPFIDNNPRFLFDLLDANEIIVQTPACWVEGAVQFGYTIDRKNTEMFGSSETYAYRNLAEGVAMEKAVQYLNDKL